MKIITAELSYNNEGLDRFAEELKVSYYMKKDKRLEFSVFNSTTGGICHYPLLSEADTRPNTQLVCLFWS